MAWVNGAVMPVEEARVSVLDQGFRTGEGVFETVRVYGTHPFRLEAHLARAEGGAARLGFAPPARPTLATAVREVIAASRTDATDLGLRITLTPGPLDPTSPFPGTPVGRPTTVITVHPLRVDPAIYARGIRAVPVPWARELPDVKAVSHLAASLARAQARRAGADEALLTTGDGTVLEGASSNVFAVRDGAVTTPPLAAGLLAGVTRQVVLDLAPAADLVVAEGPLTVSSICAADEAFVTSSTREVVPLVAIGDAPIGDGEPGPVTRRLLAAYRAEVERERGARR